MSAGGAGRGAGPEANNPGPQRLGGEDFAWYLESIPGSLFRLGTREPGSVEEFDIHQPMFDVDERCIAVGVKVMAATALTAIGGNHEADSMIAHPSPAAPVGSVRVLRQSVGGGTLAGPLLGGYSPVASP